MKQLRFLVDHQLPPQLAGALSSHDCQAMHVRDVGLDRASDALVWTFSLERRLILLSKDRDFIRMATTSHDGRLIVIGGGNSVRNIRESSAIESLMRAADRLSSSNRIVYWP